VYAKLLLLPPTVNGFWPLTSQAFCRQVASFKPRIWRDAMPLVDLLRGVLLYLLDQTESGVKLAYEYALRDALAAQEEDRKAVRAQVNGRTGVTG
jgi:hypothetical protein